MAEVYPVRFGWAMKVERGSKVIHVDPRLGRTGASADRHVPIRSGAAIAFLGGLIRHTTRT
jgi:formate dehydrogenase major subunit